MRIAILVFSTFFLFFISFQNHQFALNIPGTYFSIDTNKRQWYCKYHTLTLRTDSSFIYYSPCLNSQGTWSYKNNKVILNSKFILYGWYSGKVTTDEAYDKTNNNIRIRVLGSDKKPITCEEIRCFLNGESYTAFTDNSGYAYFPIEKFDSVQNVSISDFYRKIWQKHPETFLEKVAPSDSYFLGVKWHGIQGSFTVFYDVKNEYQHYCHFRNMEFSVNNKDGQLIANTQKQDSIIIKSFPNQPFTKKSKK